MTDPLKTQLRLPPELHQKIVDASKLSGRSMNAEMVQRLHDSFRLQEEVEELSKLLLDTQAAMRATNEAAEAARFGAGFSSQLLADTMKAMQQMSKGAPTVDANAFERVASAAEAMAVLYKDAVDPRFGTVQEAIKSAREISRKDKGDAKTKAQLDKQ